MLNLLLFAEFKPIESTKTPLEFSLDFRPQDSACPLFLLSPHARLLFLYSWWQRRFCSMYWSLGSSCSFLRFDPRAHCLSLYTLSLRLNRYCPSYNVTLSSNFQTQEAIRKLTGSDHFQPNISTTNCMPLKSASPFLHLSSPCPPPVLWAFCIGWMRVPLLCNFPTSSSLCLCGITPPSHPSLTPFLVPSNPVPLWSK